MASSALTDPPVPTTSQGPTTNSLPAASFAPTTDQTPPAVATPVSVPQSDDPATQARDLADFLRAQARPGQPSAQQP